MKKRNITLDWHHMHTWDCIILNLPYSGYYELKIMFKTIFTRRRDEMLLFIKESLEAAPKLNKPTASQIMKMANLKFGLSGDDLVEAKKRWKLANYYNRINDIPRYCEQIKIPDSVLARLQSQ